MRWIHQGAKAIALCGALVLASATCFTSYRDATIVAEFVCDDGLDDDGDGDIDCADIDCAGDFFCTECGNGVIDGAEVCDGAALGGETCVNLGLGAGLLACSVSCGAFDTTGCTGDEDCFNERDDDGDDLADCQDPDCSQLCNQAEVECDDDLDNDRDNLFDCDDADCATDPACIESICDDELDDDGDGQVDCDDSDCATDTACIESVCNDGVDDEGDGLTDCDDPDCARDPACFELECEDGRDNDEDMSTDCDDPDCADALACRCIDLGSPVGAAVVTGDTSTELHDFNSSGCSGPNGARDAQFAWTAPADGAFTFDTVGSSFDTLLYVLGGVCAGTELSCDADSGGGGTSSLTLMLTAGQTVTVVVDGGAIFSEGAFVLNITQ